MLDTQLFHLLNGLAGQSPTLDFIIVFCASHLAYVVVAVFAVFLIFFIATRRQQIELLVVAFIATALARGVITEGIRFFYHRPRPFLTLPAHKLIDDAAWSFPSGHATFFFALSTAVYLYNKKWGIGFFVATIVITLGRVAAGVHYPSDILGGALIGIGIAYLTYRIARKIATKTAD